MKINLAVYTAQEGYSWQPGSAITDSELIEYKACIGTFPSPDAAQLPFGGKFIKNGKVVFYRYHLAQKIDFCGRDALYCVLGAVPLADAPKVDPEILFQTPEFAGVMKPFPTSVEIPDAPAPAETPEWLRPLVAEEERRIAEEQRRAEAAARAEAERIAAEQRRVVEEKALLAEMERQRAENLEKFKKMLMLAAVAIGLVVIVIGAAIYYFVGNKDGSAAAAENPAAAVTAKNMEESCPSTPTKPASATTLANTAATDSKSVSPSPTNASPSAPNAEPQSTASSSRPLSDTPKPTSTTAPSAPDSTP